MAKSKLLLYLSVCVLCMGLQHAKAQRVAWSELPKEVVSSFYLAHPGWERKIVHWELADMGYVSRINLEPKEISSLFQANGEWVSTRRVVPESQLPLPAHDFISEKYAFYLLRSCTYEEDRWNGQHYYALFSIFGIEGYLTEICFDLRGNVVSIDGKEIEDLDEFEPLTEEEVLLMQQNKMLAEDQLKMEREDQDLALMDTARQRKRNDRRIYRPQTRRQFIEAKVSVQSKTAQRHIEEDSVLLAENLMKETEFPAEKNVEENENARKETTVAETDRLNEEMDNSSAQTDGQPDKTEGGEMEFGNKPVQRMDNTVAALQGKRISSNKISIRNLFPETVQKAFDHRFPKAENVKQYKDTSGMYRAVFTNFGQRAEAVIYPDGTHPTTALFFGKKDISYPIMQYIENSPEKYRFEIGKRVVYESRYRQRFSAEDKPKNYYEVVVWVKDKETKERKYFMLTFDHKAHFVSKVPYDYSKLR